MRQSLSAGRCPKVYQKVLPGQGREGKLAVAQAFQSAGRNPKR